MPKKEQGFTLLEIMLVVTIIALLLAAAIKFMAPNVDIAKRVRVAGDARLSGNQRILSYNRTRFAGFGNRAINRSTAGALAAIHGASSNRSLGNSLRLQMPWAEKSHQIRFIFGRARSDSRHRRRRSGTIAVFIPPPHPQEAASAVWARLELGWGLDFAESPHVDGFGWAGED